MSDDGPSRQQLAGACAGLVELWHTRGQINPSRLLEGYHDARLHTVSGLAAHAYRTGELAARLLREGLWLEASPIVRTSYECAVTAQWAAQVPDGVQALLNEDYRSRRNMANTLKRSEAWASAGRNSALSSFAVASPGGARSVAAACPSPMPPPLDVFKAPVGAAAAYWRRIGVRRGTTRGLFLCCPTVLPSLRLRSSAG